MWYPLGKPANPNLFHALLGAYGENKVCKQRAHPGGEGNWHHGPCAAAGYSQAVKGTLGAPEYIKPGERRPAFLG